MKKYIKYAVAFILAIVLGFGCEFLTARNMPKVKEFSFADSGIVLNPGKELYGFTPQTDPDGNLLIAKNTHLLFASDDIGGVKGVKVTFSKKHDINIPCKIFFANEEGKFIESRSVLFSLPANADEAVFAFPLDYEYFRFEIYEECEVKSISVTENELNATEIDEGFSKRRFCAVAAVLVVFFELLAFFSVLKRLFVFFKSKKKLLKIGIILLSSVVLSACFCLAATLVFKALGFLITPYLYILVSGLAVVICALVVLKDYIATKPEYFFLIASLVITTVMITATPVLHHATWDSETHYRRSLEQSYVGYVPYTQADKVITSNIYAGGSGLDLENAEDSKAYLDGLYNCGVVEIKDVPLRVLLKNVANLPHSAGMYVARMLGLSLYNIIRLTKLFNALAYCVVCFFAIKNLRYGKTLLTCILLLPTSLFMAANISYDPFIIAFIALGFSFYVNELQNPEREVNLKNMIYAILFTVIGCVSKAAYFPLIAIMFIMPFNRFSSAKRRKLYYLIVACGMMALILYFAIPYLSNIESHGDLRGGSDVSALGQIKHILAAPLEYTRILLNFLSEYLSVDVASEYTGFFAYYGKTGNSLILIAVMVVVAFTDNMKIELGEKRWLKNLYIYVVLFGIACLIATWLYIDFTPVGHNAINGCQPRYLLPLLLPALSFVGFKGLSYNGNRMIYNSAAIGMFVLYNFYAIWELIVGKYYLV